MKNALILHGTDFENTKRQIYNNWFLWLKDELTQIGYTVNLPELPQAWQPNLDRYWNFLNNFNFNKETIIVGHSSGASAMFGILHKLPSDKKINLAISVSGFYKDEGWNCEGLFQESFNWKKIKNQVEKIIILWSENDPYISEEQTNYICEKLEVKPHIIPNKQHFNLEASSDFVRFPELLDIIKSNIS